MAPQDGQLECDGLSGPFGLGAIAGSSIARRDTAGLRGPSVRFASGKSIHPWSAYILITIPRHCRSLASRGRQWPEGVPDSCPVRPVFGQVRHISGATARWEPENPGRVAPQATLFFIKEGSS
jgi:hypothetical protein